MDQKDLNLDEVNETEEADTALDESEDYDLKDDTDVEALSDDGGESDDYDDDSDEESDEDSDDESENTTDKKKKDKDDEEEDKPFWKDILEMAIYFAGVFILAVLIVTFVGQRTVVDGSSMSPTLSDKDNLIVDKISYRFSDPKRFDVVVFPYQHAKRTYYIKRIIGLPGEEVFIDADGNIYINGEILEEDYGAETILNPGRADTPIQLGPDEYFVMGDNRNNSSDSRDYMVGNVNRKDLIGRAFVRIYPFKDFCVIKHGDE